jgi:hypothetical protein
MQNVPVPVERLKTTFGESALEDSAEFVLANPR